MAYVARFSLALLSCLTSGLSAATAADIFSPAPIAGYSWSGFYAGVNGGAGYFSHSVTDNNAYIQGGVSGTFAAAKIGGFVGGTLGYNVQSGAAVFGIEADAQWSGLKSHETTGITDNRAEWNWFATVRARTGVAVDRSLFYVTGGLAVVGANYYYGNPTQENLGYFASEKKTQIGLTAGAGVEHAFNERWSIKGEYLFVGLPTLNSVDGFDGKIDFNSSAHLLRAGLNYRF